MHIAPNRVYFRQAMFLRELNTALGNHALRVQTMDYSLFASKLVTTVYNKNDYYTHACWI